MTLAEERPDYPERVAAFLTKHRLRRLPWGSIVAGGGLTVTKSRGELQARQEIGEVAITLLGALGVTAEMLDKLADLPANTTPEALVCTMQRMRDEAERNVFGICRRCGHSIFAHSQHSDRKECQARPGPSERMCECDGFVGPRTPAEWEAEPDPGAEGAHGA